MTRWTGLFAAVLVMALVALSCSSGGGSPTAPATNPDLTGSVSHIGQAQTHLWGYYDVYIDIENQTVDAVLNRQCMFTANVTSFVNGKPSNLAFKIHGTPVTTDWVDVDIDVSITHPFPAMPQYNGYDVKGVFMGPGSSTMKYSSKCKYAEYGTDQSLWDFNPTGTDPSYVDPYKVKGATGNPDGYTRWFNAKEFVFPGLMGYTQGKLATPGYQSMLTATVNPYKYFADGLKAFDNLWTWLDANPTKNGTFKSGSTNTRNYYLRFPVANGVKYGYAVVASWISETTHPANAPEAAACKVDITPNVYYKSATEKGGKLILDVNLWGWDYQPSVIKLESTVLSALHTFNASEMTPTGGDENFSTYHCEIPADSVKGNEGNDFWVIAEYGDFDYTCDLTPGGGAPASTLAAFFRYDLYVAPEPYCVDVTATGIDPDTVYAMSYTDIEITGSGFKGLSGTATTALVKFLYADGDVTATNVVVATDTLLTCDADFSDWTNDGMVDVYVENECGSSATAVDMLEFISCPPQIYYTSFDASEGEATNWSKNAPYWDCNWFTGQINDDNSACNTYGTPHYYAWRTAGIAVPGCWSGAIELAINHSCSKQESYYDRSRVEWCLDGYSWQPLNFYDHAYAYHGWWEYSWSQRASHATLTSLVNPGQTIYIRFDSYSLDSWGNSATGWNITDMTID